MEMEWGELGRQWGDGGGVERDGDGREMGWRCHGVAPRFKPGWGGGFVRTCNIGAP